MSDESGISAKNDKQQQKKPPIAFVQIGLAEPINGPVKVELSRDCSMVAEQAAFLLEKIDQSQGNLIGLQLNCPVALAAVLEEDVFLMNHNVPMEVDCKYTFRFKLTNLQAEGVVPHLVPDPVEELAMQMAQLAEGLEEQQKKWEKHQKLLEEEAAKAKMEEEQRMASAEYARLIGVPNVANLRAHYDRQKLTHLLQHCCTVQSIYIQSNQQLNDLGLLQSIVDLLATVEKPAKLIGQVTIEHSGHSLTWPKRDELKLKELTRSVTITYNEVSGPPPSQYNTNPNAHRFLAEYELSNRGVHFEVLVYYWEEKDFNKSVAKFAYRRIA